MSNDDKTKQSCEVYSYKKKKPPVWLGTLFVIVALFIFGFVFVSCESNGTVVREKVEVGVSKSFLSLPVYVAQKQGFFSEEGLNVTVKGYGSGKKATEALFAGEVDISTVADIPVVFNSFKRQDFCIFTTMQYSDSLIKMIARKDKGIKTGADLREKKVGTNKGTTSHFFLAVFLIHNQLSVSDMKIINMKMRDLPSALKNGEVDAISVWEPHTQKAKELLGDNAIELEGSEILRTNGHFATMKRFDQEHQQILQKFLRALDQATTFIKNEREKSQEIAAASLNLSRDTMNAAWDEIVFEIFLDQSLLVGWDDIARWAIENELTNKKELPNYFYYICLDALEAVKPKSITIIR
jgi:NitT/TauT family transport system substrate-binding protein